MPVYNYYYLVDGKFNPGTLTVHGPTIPVQVDVPSALAQAMNVTGQQIPQGIPGRALIDTGASITAVDAGIISQLGVPPVSRARVLTPSGEAEQDVFPATISFPGTPSQELNSLGWSGVNFVSKV